MENTITSMNGATVLARYQKTVFIRIPREIQQPIRDGCACDYCKAHPKLTPMWDTLCVGTTSPKTGNDFVWTVHCPDPTCLFEAERKERSLRGSKTPSSVEAH